MWLQKISEVHAGIRGNGLMDNEQILGGKNTEHKCGRSVQKDQKTSRRENVLFSRTNKI